MERSLKTGFAQISLAAPKKLSCPKIGGGGGGGEGRRMLRTEGNLRNALMKHFFVDSRRLQNLADPLYWPKLKTKKAVYKNANPIRIELRDILWLRESLLSVGHTRKRESNQGSIIIITIIGRGWAKYRDLSVASRSIICRNRRLRQIFELWDTDKSRYFVITEFNNCLIIQSPGLFFNEHLLKVKPSFSAPVLTPLTRSGVEIAMWSAIFTQERSQEGEKRGFLYAWAEYHLQPNTVGRQCA